MGIRIEGLDSLIAKMTKLGGNVDEACERAMRKSLALVRDAAKLNCPVSLGGGDITKTISEDGEKQESPSVPSGGHLRESIHSRYTHAGNIHKGAVFTNTEHAAYVEFGTGPKGRGTYPYPTEFPLSYKADKWRVNIPGVGVRWIDGQAAQPYLYPALADNKERIFEIFKEILTEELNKIEKRGP